MIEIVFDSRDVEKFLDDLSYKGMRRAVARSLNEAARAARAESIKRIRNIKKIKQPQRRINFFKANPLMWRATLKISDYGSPLYDFNARRRIVKTPKGKRIGVTVEVNKGKRVLVKGGFIAETRHRLGVYRRQGKERDKIIHMLTSSVYDIFKETKFAESIQKFAQNKFDERFTKNLEFYLRGL